MFTVPHTRKAKNDRNKKNLTSKTPSWPEDATGEVAREATEYTEGLDGGATERQLRESGSKEM